MTSGLKLLIKSNLGSPALFLSVDVGGGGGCWVVAGGGALLLRCLSAFLLLPPELLPLPRDVSDETFHLNMLPIQTTFWVALGCSAIRHRVSRRCSKLSKKNTFFFSQKEPKGKEQRQKISIRTGVRPVSN